MFFMFIDVVLQGGIFFCFVLSPSDQTCVTPLYSCMGHNLVYFVHVPFYVPS